MQITRVVRGNATPLAVGVRNVTSNGHVETVSGPLITEYNWDDAIVYETQAPAPRRARVAQRVVRSHAVHIARKQPAKRKVQRAINYDLLK